MVSNNLTDVNIAREYSGRYLKGWVDEVRISSVARSEAWLRATWRNLADSAAYTVCSAVTPRTPVLPVVAVAEASNVTATTATLNGMLLSTGTVIEVKAYWGQTDGGTTPAAWSNSVSLGARSYGAFSSAITGLVPGSIYYARFWATNNSGAAWSPTAAVFAALTAAPASLTAVGTAGQVAFSWDAVAGSTDYTLSRSLVSGGPYTSLLTGIQTTNALDLTAQTGVTYYYVVRAAKNGVESANSTQVVVSPVGVPSDVVASPGNGSIALAWTAVTGATGYTVSRALDEAGPYTVVQSGITGTTFNDTGRSNGTRYWYTIQATAAGFNGEPCAAVSAVPQTAQAAPTGLAAIPLNASAQLNWNSATDATSYTLKRGTSAVGPFSTVASGLLVSPRIDTGLANGTTYYYVVSALYWTTASTNSAPVSVIPAVPPTVFVTASPGDWSGAVWSPSLPWAGSTVKVIFNNASSIATTNNLGPFLLNTVILHHQLPILLLSVTH